MLKSDLQGIISKNEKLKAKFYALNTEDDDVKAVKCERIIKQCQQVLRSMQAVDTEVDLLEEMLY